MCVHDNNESSDTVVEAPAFGVFQDAGGQVVIVTRQGTFYVDGGSNLHTGDGVPENGLSAEELLGIGYKQLV